MSSVAILKYRLSGANNSATTIFKVQLDNDNNFTATFDNDKNFPSIQLPNNQTTPGIISNIYYSKNSENLNSVIGVSIFFYTKDSVNLTNVSFEIILSGKSDFSKSVYYFSNLTAITPNNNTEPIYKYIFESKAQGHDNNTATFSSAAVQRGTTAATLTTSALTIVDPSKTTFTDDEAADIAYLVRQATSHGVSSVEYLGDAISKVMKASIN